MSEATTASRPHFWADDFDMDLLKVFPDVPKMLRDPERVLWTVGHTSYGRINHPNVWNTHGAYLWLEKPNLERDEHGWFNVAGCVGNSPEVECTWLEWLRDAWSHTYGAIILPYRQRLPPSEWRYFEPIMYDLRGWRKQDVSEHRKEALKWVMRCDLLLSRAVDPNTTTIAEMSGSVDFGEGFKLGEYLDSIRGKQ